MARIIELRVDQLEPGQVVHAVARAIARGDWVRGGADGQIDAAKLGPGQAAAGQAGTGQASGQPGAIHQGAASQAAASLGAANQASGGDDDAIYVVLLTTQGCDFVGCGLKDLLKAETGASVGAYGFANTDNCECVVQGNAGDYFGHSQVSGTLTVMGSVSDSLGAMAIGGLNVVLGDAGNRAGVSLRGADLLVRGDVGSHAGYRMESGTLVIGGNAGPNLGAQMRGGSIYIRGEAQSISSDIEEARLREPDRLKLSLLLMKAGIRASALKEFRVYRKPD
jgi:formylmethanofuran dehydrogenase subunit C